MAMACHVLGSIKRGEKLNEYHWTPQTGVCGIYAILPCPQQNVARTEQCTLPLGAGAEAITHDAVNTGGIVQVKRSRAQLSSLAEQLTGICCSITAWEGRGVDQGSIVAQCSI